ncbi:MAG: efflux RND transporter periplasmic adaptor subunit [Planctomycetaceae bacterium]
MRTRAAGVVGGLIVCLVSGTANVGVSADGPTAEPKRPLTLDRCHIELIDQVTLASDRPGILAFVEPREGDRVQKDQRVANLDDRVAAAKLKVAEKQAENDVEIRYAKAAYEVADIKHRRMVEANRRQEKVIPELEVMAAKLEADRAFLQIEQATHEFDVAQKTMLEAKAEWETYQILAPFDGVVTKVYKKKGEAVKQGDPILEVSNTERVRVEGELPIRDLHRVKPGQQVYVQLDIEGVDLPQEAKKFPGRLVFVDLSVTGIDHTVRVWAEVQNSENLLRAGLNAKMMIYPGMATPTDTVSTQQ